MLILGVKLNESVHLFDGKRTKPIASIVFESYLPHNTVRLRCHAPLIASLQRENLSGAITLWHVARFAGLSRSNTVSKVCQWGETVSLFKGVVRLAAFDFAKKNAGIRLTLDLPDHIKVLRDTVYQKQPHSRVGWLKTLMDYLRSKKKGVINHVTENHHP